MRSIIIVVVISALIGLTGCANRDTTPTDQPEPETENVIKTEDFESGEVEGVVEDAEDVAEEAQEAVEETPAGDDH